MGAFADARRRRVREITPVAGFIIFDNGLPDKRTNRLAALMVAYVYHRGRYSLHHINGYFPASLMTLMNSTAAETLYNVLPELSAEDAAYLRGFSRELPDSPPSSPDLSHPVVRDAVALSNYFAEQPNGDALLASFVSVSASD